MDVTLAVLADFASITREGKLNILGVFGEINPPRLPFVLPSMVLVMAYSAGPAEFGLQRKARIVLTDADGKQVLGVEQDLSIPRARRAGAKVQMNQILGLAGVRFEQSGDYQFSVLVDNDEKRTISLRVNEPSQEDRRSDD